MIDDLIVSIRSRRSRSGRQYRAKSLDLGHLRDGRKAAGTNMRGHSGRPLMAKQCVTAKRKSMAVRGRDAATTWGGSLSYFWHAMDHIEAANPTIGRIDDVLRIPGEIWDAFCEYLDNDDAIASRKAEIYIYCSDTVTAACTKAGVRVKLPENPHDTKVASKRRSVEAPYSEDLNAEIVAAFRSERMRVQARFKLANELADKSTANLLDYTSRDDWSFRKYRDIVTRENVLHFVKHELLPWIPNFTEFEAHYGFQPRKMGQPPDAMPVRLTAAANPKSGLRREDGSGPGLGALYRWFMPAQFDLVPFITEAVHATGGNLAAILDFDRHDWCRVNRRTGMAVVYSRKARSLGENIEWDARIDDPNSIYSIINSAIEMTEPMHRYVEAQLEKLMSGPKTPQTKAKIDRLLPLRGRVWVGLGVAHIGPIGMDPENDPFHDIASEILRRHNVTECGEPARWSARRVRDDFAAKVHTSSKFNWKTLQKKMKHKKPGTAAWYLEQPELTIEQSLMIHERVVQLTDDPQTRASFWPARAEANDHLPTSGRAMTILVMPKGVEWATNAGFLGAGADARGVEEQS